MTTMAGVIPTASPPSTFSLHRNNHYHLLLRPPHSLSSLRPTTTLKPIHRKVAVKSSPSISIDDDPTVDDELKQKLDTVGSRVRVRAPLKVYHVPRVPEVELAEGTEGVVKQYVALWKGKRISANYPYKVEFQIEVEGRGSVKFVAHLREDEFEFI